MELATSEYPAALKNFGNRMLLAMKFGPKLLRSRDASAWYTMIGDDVIPTLNGRFADTSKELWLNIGYWKDARTYPEACRAMAILLGETAELTSTDTVLDVGCGFAEQDALLAERFHVADIVGIDITPVHVAVGQDRLRAKKLNDRVTLSVGSAVRTGFPDNSFDKVLALECAFHFDTREKFLAEAFRVLKPGGRLALTDMLPAPGQDFSGPIRRIARKASFIPEVNMYDRVAYAEKLRTIGFVEVSVRSIAGYVYPGMARYEEKRLNRQAHCNIRIDQLTNDDIDNVRGVEKWAVAGIDDYIIATACKA